MHLLRRVPADAVRRDVFAVVVPNVAVPYAVRGLAEVQAALDIHICVVTAGNTASYVGDGTDPPA